MDRGNNDEEPNVDTQNGFIKNTNAGVVVTNGTTSIL
jgi:hypothetical protein